MISHGIISFLNAKSLNHKATINSYLQQHNKPFGFKNHFKVNSFIEENFSRFAQFCDAGIKSGKFKGNAVRLNYSYQEQRERDSAVKQEYEALSLSKDHEFLLKIIKENHGGSELESFINKMGYSGIQKDFSFTSKRLQFLPQINKVIELGIDKFKEHVKLRYNKEY